MRFLATILSTFTVIALSTSGCSYNFGYSQRTLPGGYKQVAVPVFQNKTKEVGAERYFTDALVREFNRSQVAQVVDREKAAVVVEGTIKTVTFIPAALVLGNSAANLIGLPGNAVLGTSYSVNITAKLLLRRISDQKVMWEGEFNDEQVYQAPQVGQPGINSVDPLYNRSAHKAVVEQLALDMMNDAHDRMTENF